MIFFVFRPFFDKKNFFLWDQTWDNFDDNSLESFATIQYLTNSFIFVRTYKREKKFKAITGVLVFKNGQIPASFLFSFFFVIISIQIEKSVGGVLWIRTWRRRMVGADETTELWRPQLGPLLLADGVASLVDISFFIVSMIFSSVWSLLD